MNLGRNQLLAWVNHVACCEYTSIEMLADGVAFAQLIDAIHPGSINIFKLNLSTRYPDDCLRNLKIVEDALKKLKIGQPFSFDKMARGRFQDNITFLQWIYSYSLKCGLQNLQTYQPFQRRVQIIERQGKGIRQINPHLIQNQNYMQYEQGENKQDYQDEGQYRDSRINQDQDLMERIQYMKEYIGQEQNHLKGKMQLNWRLMQYIDRSIQDRNTLYSLLKQVQNYAKQVPVSSIQKQILNIVHETPQDFN